jgi:hypothetical protein
MKVAVTVRATADAAFQGSTRAPPDDGAHSNIAPSDETVVVA